MINLWLTNHNMIIPINFDDVDYCGIKIFTEEEKAKFLLEM